jgi:hypothetical protein
MSAAEIMGRLYAFWKRQSTSAPTDKSQEGDFLDSTQTGLRTGLRKRDFLCDFKDALSRRRRAHGRMCF